MREPPSKPPPEARMPPQQKRALEARFRRYINRGQVRYLKAGHLDVVERNRGAACFSDAESGRRFFDCFSSAGSFNIGRRNPHAVAALEAAAGELDLGTHQLGSRHKVALADRLVRLAPGDLNGAKLLAGGGDAVDAALKLARGATGRPAILSTVKAYHGHTGFALSAIGKEHYRWYCEPLLPSVAFLPFNDLDAMAARIGLDTAAVIIEPVQGEAGIYPADPDYLRGIRACCDRHGALLIFDEIQTGFGRTGKLFASEHADVVPDIMTLAKSLGGGIFPSAAMLYRKTPAITAFLEAHPDFHPSCGGGSDLACRTSLAVLDYLEGEVLWENAATMGARLKAALETLQQAHPRIIRDVRGLGLMLGIEYCHEFMGPMMSDALAKHGVFAAYSGNAPQVMRFMPPLTVTEADVDAITAAVQAAVRDMQRLLPFAMAAAKVPGVLPLLNNERIQTLAFGALRVFERRGGAS